MRTLLLALTVTVLSGQTHRHGIHEVRLQAAVDVAAPLELETRAAITRPDGKVDHVRAFWNGGREWLVRYSPELAGPYKWRTTSSEPSLNGRTGSFRATAYNGPNVLYRSGQPRVSKDGRYFVHADGKPWFWLADTAWNGALLATDEEWPRYIADRVAKRFAAAQVVMTQWRASYKDENGDVAFTGRDQIAVNPAFFQRLDKRIHALNEAGLVAVPVILWALTSKQMESPGVGLPTSQAKLLARYIADRYGAHKVIWFLGGDGDYIGPDKVAKWTEIGRFAFPAWMKRAPVGLHPGGMKSPFAPFQNEPWMDVLFFQTGHGGDLRKWKWHIFDGGAAAWKTNPPRPVIDAEPNYEAHMGYHKKLIDDYAVRRAAYTSLLNAPTAGVSYGAHGIWPWMRERGVPLNHPGAGEAEPWSTYLDYPGARQMKVMRDIFDSFEWWRLRPDRCLLGAEAPDPELQHYAMSAVAEGGGLGLLYFPTPIEREINPSALGARVRGTWIDPRTGARSEAGTWTTGPLKVTPPGAGDWLLLLTPAR